MNDMAGGSDNLAVSDYSTLKYNEAPAVGGSNGTSSTTNSTGVKHEASSTSTSNSAGTAPIVYNNGPSSSNLSGAIPGTGNAGSDDKVSADVRAKIFNDNLLYERNRSDKEADFERSQQEFDRRFRMEQQEYERRREQKQQDAANRQGRGGVPVGPIQYPKDFRNVHSDMPNPDKPIEVAIKASYSGSSGKFTVQSPSISQPSLKDLVNGEDSFAIQRKRAHDPFGRSLAAMANTADSFTGMREFKGVGGFGDPTLAGVYKENARKAYEAYVRYGNQKGLDRWKLYNHPPAQYEDQQSLRVSRVFLPAAMNGVTPEVGPWGVQRNYLVGQGMYAHADGTRVTEIGRGIGAAKIYRLG